MITVVTPASSQALTTLTHIKDLLGITDGSKDSVLQLLIDQTSDEIAGECGRVFGRETVTESLSGSGRRRLVLSRRPVISVSAVRYYGQVIDPASYWLEDRQAGILFSTSGWQSESFAVGVARDAASPEVGPERYSVDYVGGYWLPSFTTVAYDVGPPEVLADPSAADIRMPSALESIVLDVVVSKYRQIGTDRDIDSYSLGDYSVQFRNTTNSMSGEVTRRLQRFMSLT